MMGARVNRRQLTKAGLSLLATQALPASVFASPTTINGDFFFYLKDGTLGVHTQNVTIDGLPFEKFTWQWVGMGLAEGVLSSIGGQLFGAFANAIFGGTKKSKTMEQLLAEQLEEFARLLNQAITQNEVRRYGADLAAYLQLYRSYERTPSKEGLRFLFEHTATGLTNLESLGFAGYRTQLSAASLRLSVVQQAIKRKMAKSADFSDQVDHSKAHHESMIAYIDAQTEPATWASRVVEPPTTFDNGNETPAGRTWWFSARWMPRQYILGRPIEGWILYNDDRTTLRDIADVTKHKAFANRSGQHYTADRIIDWAWLRDTTKAENTVYGDKMVRRWTDAVLRV